MVGWGNTETDSIMFLKIPYTYIVVVSKYLLFHHCNCSYYYEDERGLFPETQFVFDLQLPIDFTPTVSDGEVSEFYMWTLAEV